MVVNGIAIPCCGPPLGALAGACEVAVEGAAFETVLPAPCELVDGELGGVSITDGIVGLGSGGTTDTSETCVGTFKVGSGSGGSGSTPKHAITIGATRIARDQTLVVISSPPPPMRRHPLSTTRRPIFLLVLRQTRQSFYAAFVGADMERAVGALRDFTRRDILLRFFADRKARSVEDVSREAGVHRSVAFEHLERLVALGYLEVAHRRGLPGKPAKIYKLIGGPVQISHPMRRYDIIAESLARAFDGLGEIGSHAVRRAGRNFGESIAVPGAKSTLAALEPMFEMGADYEMGSGEIINCGNCLFAEVCRRAPIVCRFHAGVIEGLLEHAEPNLSVKVLGFRDPYGCAYMLQEDVAVEPLEAEAQ